MPVPYPARWCAVVALLLTGLAACTAEPGPPPAPPPTPLEERPAAAPALGQTIGVVLPPVTDVDPAVHTAVEADVSRLASSLGSEVRDVRTIVPDETPFVRDLAMVLAERDTDLVCVVGTTHDGLRELAELHPDQRFCATSDRWEAALRGELELVEVRAAELGHVVGVAAAAAAGEEGRVALVLGGDELPSAPFRAGVLAGLGDTEVVAVDVADGLDAAVAEAVDGEADVIVMDGARGATDAVEAAAEAAFVLAPSAVVGGAGGQAVLSWRVRWDLVLRRPVAGLLGWTDRGPPSLGLEQDVFTLTLRPAASGAVRRTVDATVEQLAAGVRDPLGAPPPELPPELLPDGADGAEPEAPSGPNAEDEAGS